MSVALIENNRKLPFKPDCYVKAEYFLVGINFEYYICQLINHHMRKLTATLLLSFTFVTIFSQKNILPGYIVLPSKDTVRGSIDYRNWEKNPTQIRFSQSPSESRSYTISDIEAFGVTGMDYYRKATVRVDDNPVRLSDIIVYSEELIQDQTVFLRILAEGKELTLYELVNFKTHYFIAKGGGPVEELSYKLIKDDQTNNIVTKNDFRVQLKKLISSNGSLSYEQSLAIDQLNYKEKDLVNFVSQVNGLSSDKISFANKKKEKPRLFAGGGVVFPNLSFQSTDARLKSIKYKNKFSYIITGGADFFASRNQQHLFLRTELSISTLETEGSGVSENTTSPTTQKNEYSLKQFNLTPAIFIMDYFLPFKKAKICAGAGIAYNFSTYPTQLFTTTNSLTGNGTKDENYPPLEKGWIAFYGRLGVTVLSKVDIGVTARIGGAFINVANTDQKGVPLSFQVLYLFN
jgi:hypothetical protein